MTRAVVMAWVFSAVFTCSRLNGTGSWQPDIVRPTLSREEHRVNSGRPFQPKLICDSVTRLLESLSASGSFCVVAHVTGEAQGRGVLNY